MPKKKAPPRPPRRKKKAAKRRGKVEHVEVCGTCIDCDEPFERVMNPTILLLCLPCFDHRIEDGLPVKPKKKIVKKSVIELLEPHEVNALLNACAVSTLKQQDKSQSNVRDRAIISVLYGAGLRISECLSLLPKHVGYEKNTLVVVGKGNKLRTVACEQGAIDSIQVWVALRDRHSDELCIETTSPLFCTVSSRGKGPGTHVSPRQIDTKLKLLAKRAGQVKRVHAHGFRHFHAVQLMYKGWPIHEISVQLGHANSWQTAQYLDHIAPRVVIDRMKNEGKWVLE